VIYVEQSVGLAIALFKQGTQRSDRSLPNTEKSRPLETSTRENGRIGRSDQGACRIAVLRTESCVKERHHTRFRASTKSMISSERAEEILRRFDFDEPRRVRSALCELSQPLTDQEPKELLDHADLTGEQRQRIAEELRSRAEREEKDEKT
jgi:hypothetical protein